MSAPGGVALHTDLLHVWSFIEIMTVSQPATGYQRTNDVAIAACSVANGTFCIVPLDLVCRKLVKLFGSCQAGPHGHLPLLAGSVVQAGHKIIGDGLMAGCAFLTI
jgi:hypothetical protein